MFLKRLNELGICVEKCEYATKKGIIAPEDALKMAHFLIAQVKKNQGTVYLVGNGGSAGIASHFCTDLLRTLHVPAATLTDSNMVTCFANDFGYENVFSLPLERKLRNDDLLIAISSSGKSPNIVNAALLSQEKKVPVITLSGFSSKNPLREIGDLNFWLDSMDYGLVETGHFFLLHTLIDSYPREKAIPQPEKTLVYARKN